MRKVDKIVKKGDCTGLDRLDPWRDKTAINNEKWMNFTLTEDGVLRISGNTWLSAVPTPDATPYFDEPIGPPTGWSEYESQFKNMDFHTVIIEDGVIGLGEKCFKDCKSFKKIIFNGKIPTIRKSFAEGSPFEYTIKEELKFIGTETNPLYYLMGCTDDFQKEKLIIPEGTIRIADEAFSHKKFIKDVVFPSTLEFAGWYTFDGTSIKDVFIPEGKLAYDETLLAFEGWTIKLESISLPYSMYQIYKEGKDTGLVEAWNSTCKIIYRNPDDSIAEILEPKPLDHNNIPPTEYLETNPDKDSEELPF